VLHEDYLQYRIRSVAYLGDILTANGVPIVQPPGGHAIYIDARAMLPHIPQDEYPAWALSLALYLEGGIRSVEIGSVMFGRQPDGSEKPAAMELVRMAFPRRVYTQSHVDYLAEVKGRILRMVEAPETSRRGWNTASCWRLPERLDCRRAANCDKNHRLTERQRPLGVKHIIAVLSRSES
jgi:tryptophanase